MDPTSKQYQDFDDAVYIQHALQGDSRAAEALIQQYYGTVFSLAFANLNYERERAEDLAQEVFLRAFLHLSKLQRPAYFPRWLVQITRNLAADWQRHNRYTSGIIQMLHIDAQEVNAMQSSIPNPRENAAATESSEQISHAMRTLPVLERELIQLQFVEGLSQAQTARQVGLHSSTVMRKTDTALQRLRKILSADLRRYLVKQHASPSKTASTVGLVLGALALPAATRASLAQACIVSGNSFAGTTPVLAGVGLAKVAAVLLAGVILVASTVPVYQRVFRSDSDSGQASVQQLKSRTSPAVVTEVATPRRQLAGSTTTQQWLTRGRGIAVPVGRPGTVNTHSARIQQVLALQPSLQIDSGTTNTVYTLTGRVADRATQLGIAGVSLSIGKARAVTDSNGRYRLEQVNPRSHGVLSTGQMTVITVDKEGYTLPLEGMGLRQAGVKFDPAEPNPAYDIELVKMVPLAGTVRAADGAALTGTSVTLVCSVFDAPSQERLTDSAGGFTLNTIPGTSVRVMAENPSIAQSLSEIVDVREQPISKVDILALPGAQLSGTVVDAESRPVSGSTIQASYYIPLHGTSPVAGDLGHSLKTKSDEAGKFMLPHLPAQELTLYAHSPQMLYSNEIKLQLTEGESTRRVELRLPKPHYLAGRITDPAGNPVTRIQVGAYAGITGGPVLGNGTMTDADGRYRIENLPDPPISLDVWTPSGALHEKVMQLDRENADFVVGAKHEGPTALLIGKVLDAESSSPLAVFTITSKHDAAHPEKRKDRTGEFTVKELRPGASYSFLVEARGYAPLEEDVEMQQGTSVTEHVFAIGRPGGLRGRLVSETGNPLAAAKVQVKMTEFSYEAPDAITVTAEDGRFEVTGLRSGTAYVLIETSGTAQQLSREAKVRFGQITDIGDLSPVSGLRIHGRVIKSARDVPVIGTQVTLRVQSNVDFHLTTATLDDGSFVFAGLQKGHYTVEVPELGLSSYVMLDRNPEPDLTVKVGSASVAGTLRVRGKRLEQQGIVSLTLRGGAGKGIDLSASGGPGDETDFEYKNLLAGNWELFAYGGGRGRFNPITEKITVTEGQHLRHDVELPAGVVEGVVTDTSGTAVASAHIILERLGVAKTRNNKGAVGGDVTSNQNGKFVADVLNQGDYQITARDSTGRATAEPLAVHVSNDQDTTGVQLTVK